jgi:hypothetical protein
MTVTPPTDPWHRRFLGSRRRAGGCGCLGTLLLGILLSVVLSALLPNSTAICLPFVF